MFYGRMDINPADLSKEERWALMLTFAHEDAAESGFRQQVKGVRVSGDRWSYVICGTRTAIPPERAFPTPEDWDASMKAMQLYAAQTGMKVRLYGMYFDGSWYYAAETTNVPTGLRRRVVV